MPPKRRASGPKPTTTQSTLAFHGRSNRVTKSAKLAGSKDKDKDTAVAAPTKPSKLALTPLAGSPSGTSTPSPASTSPTEVLEPAASTSETALLQQAISQAASPTPEEAEARSVTAARIESYWRAKEASRKAPRVHQDDLSLHEKILREFDTNAAYGPAMGKTRLYRWKRAYKLGLRPPIEVLAVLLKQLDGTPTASSLRAHRAYVDELMNSRFISDH